MESLSRFFLLLCTIHPCVLHSQSAPRIEWQRCYGDLDSNSDEHEKAVYDRTVASTKDGGYIFAAQASMNNGDVSGVHTGSKSDDIWISKVSSSGIIQWQKSFGGTSTEAPRSIIQTSDGGYVFCGFTTSTDGDPPKTLGDNTNGFHDGWIVKLNASGTIEWQQRVGGLKEDNLYSIVQTLDGGLIAAGYSRSSGEEGSFNHGSHDAFIIRLNVKGEILWKRLYGGSLSDGAFSILQLADSGFLFVGSATSNDGDVTGKTSNNRMDIWIVRLDQMGKLLWQRSYGGSGEDGAYSVVACPDGGYAVTGYTWSSDGDVTFNHGKGATDLWVFKIDSLGLLQWQKTFGGAGSEIGRSIILAEDSSFVITGYTNSNDGDVSGLFLEGPDTWICKLSPIGSLLWQKVLGGTNTDYGNCTIQTPDRGYLVYSTTVSTDGDVIGNTKGRKAWLVKLAPESSGVETGTIASAFKNPYPNPSTDEVRMEVSRSIPLKEIRFFNLIGTEFYPEYKIEHSTVSIDVHDLPSGLYITRIGYRTLYSIQEEIRKFIRE